MKKLFIMALLFSVSSFALSLDQVRQDLYKKTANRDSSEIKIRTTINSVAGSQVVSVYLVQKGKAKSYSEIKAAFLNQRTVVNGNRMKVIDLNTKKFQILPYNGESLEALSYVRINPLDSGIWEEPRFVSEDLYSIKGEKGTLFYDAKRKRIEKMESIDSEKNVLVNFAYDDEDNLKSMKTSVVSNGKETTVVTEILLLRGSAKFPDRLFEF
jgi:hypothetical protein